MHTIKYLFLLLLLIANSLHADQTLNTYFTTAKEFKQLISDEKKINKMPRLSDKKVATMIEILSNRQNYLFSKKYSHNDLNTIMNMCGTSRDLIMEYALFGIEKEINNNTNSANNIQKIQKLMNTNSIFFQDELSKLQPFFISCMATQLPLTANFIHSLKPEEITEVRINGLRQMQKGLFGIYIGTLNNSNNEKLNFAYRKEIIKTLSDSAAIFAQVLPIHLRLQIINYIKSTESLISPKLNDDYKKIINAMSNQICEGLCTF